VQHRRIVTWLRYIVCTDDLRHTVSYSDKYGDIDTDQYADRHTQYFADMYTEWRSTGTVGNRNTRTGTQV